MLAEHFFLKSCQKNKRQLGGFSRQAQKLILEYPWPGNVRELINAMERAVLLARGPLLEEHDLPPAMLRESIKEYSHDQVRAGITLQEMERRLILATLKSTQGNRTQSARLLGITRKTLQNKIKEFSL